MNVGDDVVQKRGDQKIDHAGRAAQWSIFSHLFWTVCDSDGTHAAHTHTHNNTNGEKREERKNKNKKQESKAIHHRRREAQQSLEGEQKAKPRIVSFFSFFFLIHLSRARPESGGAFSMRYTHTHEIERWRDRLCCLFLSSFCIILASSEILLLNAPVWIVDAGVVSMLHRCCSCCRSAQCKYTLYKQWEHKYRRKKDILADRQIWLGQKKSKRDEEMAVVFSSRNHPSHFLQLLFQLCALLTLDSVVACSMEADSICSISNQFPLLQVHS